MFHVTGGQLLGVSTGVTYIYLVNFKNCLDIIKKSLYNINILNVQSICIIIISQLFDSCLYCMINSIVINYTYY
jgi:hypothetical protein